MPAWSAASFTVCTLPVSKSLLASTTFKSTSGTARSFITKYLVPITCTHISHHYGLFLIPACYPSARPLPFCLFYFIGPLCSANIISVISKELTVSKFPLLLTLVCQREILYHKPYFLASKIYALFFKPFKQPSKHNHRCCCQHHFRWKLCIGKSV